MDFISVFQMILENLQREKIDFALIGGLALQAAGISRATYDIDMLILSENSRKIKEVMSGLGFRLLHESEDVLNFASDNIRLGRVDFLLAHRKYALAMLKRAGEKEVLGGRFKAKVIRLEDQIGLKVQSSSNDPRRWFRDMSDIELLIKNNYARLDLDVLREYFRLFDREEELNQILEREKDVN